MGKRKKYVDSFNVDRLSMLPIDMIYLILSFLDIKYVVQTTTLSTTWKNLWKSVTHLNFDTYKFHTMPQFTKFVNNVLSKRDPGSQVSTLELRFKGPATEYVIENIVNYAYLHNVTKLSFLWFTYKEHDFPPYLFKCHTLKHLTLAVYNRNMVAGICHLPELPWDFPALETLNLRDVRFHECKDESANMFSKCVNLKDLTLYGFMMPPSKTFNIVAPKLSSLTIRNAYFFPKVLNVVAPELKELTASIQSSLQIQHGDYLQLSNVMFDSLEKVTLSKNDTLDYNYEKHFSRVLDLFEKLHSAKFLMLDMNIIQILSSCKNDLLLDPALSPFNNLTCLRVDATHMKAMKGVPMIDIRVKNYLLPNATDSTFIMDPPPQVPEKSIQKRTMLIAENKQSETIDQEKKMMEVEMQRQNKVIAEQKARIKRQDRVVAEQDRVVAEQDRVIAEQDRVIAELKSKLEFLEATKVGSSSKCPHTRSKRVV